MSKNPDLVYTDRSGRRNPEYISLGCDSLPVLRGRTPIQVYSDYMRNFRERFQDYLGNVIEVIINTVVGSQQKSLATRYSPKCIYKISRPYSLQEIQVGMGPCGELRYPAYPESNGTWKFPGIGEFQCYDKVTYFASKAQVS